MAQAQLERWYAEHPTAVRRGKIFDVPFSYTGPRIAAAMVLAGAIWWAVPVLTWNHKPETLSPEFVAEAKKVGAVAQRMNAPPVFLNPFTNRIPGGIVGPEDVKMD